MIGFVYIIRCEDYVKIGWSRNPKSRLATAQTFNPHAVELLSYYSAHKNEEKAIHERFREYSNGSGEWFRFSDEICLWVNSIRTAKDDILIEWFKRNRGAKVRLANHLGLTAGAISQWRRVPELYLLTVERFTGIDRRELRPDIFHAQTPEQFNASRSAA